MADIKLVAQEQLYGSLNNSLPPNNEILVDDKGKPSVMVKIPKFSMSDVGLSGGTHPAFIVNGVEKPYIYISKYQNIVEADRAYSLPYQAPRAYVNFDEAKAYCENKGAGWHLMTNAEWAAIALWCKKHECMPYGNNNYSYGDYYFPNDKGAPMPVWDDNMGDNIPYTATGSGPKNWFHNDDYSGIADLNGNVYEWVGGLRLNAGEIQIIENNNAAQAVDQSASSPLWKAMAQNGSLVAPGTANTLKYASGSISANSAFKDMSANVTIPNLLKALALYPADDAATYRDDYFFTSSSGEKLPIRGGNYDAFTYAGVFYCDLVSSRAASAIFFGFRSAFVDL